MHICRLLGLIWSLESRQGYIYKIPGTSAINRHCQRGSFVSFPLIKVIPSRFALEMHQDPRWSAKICANLIYPSAPSLWPLDCFEIRVGALIFVHARSPLRVWSIAGFKPYLLGPDMRWGVFRPSPATAEGAACTFGIVEPFWVDWYHCRRREITGGAGAPPWSLF